MELAITPQIINLIEKLYSDSKSVNDYLKETILTADTSKIAETLMNQAYSTYVTLRELYYSSKYVVNSFNLELLFAEFEIFVNYFFKSVKHKQDLWYLHRCFESFTETCIISE